MDSDTDTFPILRRERVRKRNPEGLECEGFLFLTLSILTIRNVTISLYFDYLNLVLLDFVRQVKGNKHYLTTHCARGGGGLHILHT